MPHLFFHFGKIILLSNYIYNILKKILNLDFGLTH
jgi:hypothetical protein